MYPTLTKTLTPEWKTRLGLAHRHSPELYESAEAVSDVPHAPAIRTALTDMGISAIFCVQGVPTVAILEADDYDRGRIIDLHGKLWNQGLASLLLVIAEDSLRPFSLVRTPFRYPDDAFEEHCLIDHLSLASEVLRFQDLIYGAESGRLWNDYSKFFPPKERIDHVLLNNLTVSHDLMQDAGLAPDAAQALLIQAMFIGYLEAREIVTPAYFAAISEKSAENFAALLETGDVDLFRSFFRMLHKDFNGDLFVAPCSFEPMGDSSDVTPNHLTILARFLSGREEMAHSGGQLRFWGYDFRYIPIELVSAVYDRFLGDRDDDRRADGAYYTPTFLADTVVSQAWEMLPDEARTTGNFLDPACGSGIFLVRSFLRLCEHWRATHKTQAISWKKLLSLLNQIHGWDLNGSAVRVAVFSLYVALLEEVSPRDIRKLISRGKFLPKLWGRTLVCNDFFDVPLESKKYEVIIGNPPWASRRGTMRSSVQWGKNTGHPMPAGEDAWAFSWKALSHLADGGLIAFLLPAMGFLHNDTRETVKARDAFFRESKVYRIINFADLRLQLFKKAQRSTALIIYGSAKAENFPYVFDYWTPKADLNLRIKRVITLSSADKTKLSVGTVLDNPRIFKQLLWMQEPDAKLFGYLERLPKLKDLVTDFKSLTCREQPGNRWVIGLGYQPFNGISANKAHSSEYVGRLPDLPISEYSRLAQPVEGLKVATSSMVRRRGFEAGFDGTRILIPRGVETSQNRLRAAYCDEPLTFQHIIAAIVVPGNQDDRAKVLTGILNSSVAIWYAFHGTASYGAERPEIKQTDMLLLPFPSPDDLPDKDAATQAALELIAIVDCACKRSNEPFPILVDECETLRTIDRLTYQYFCLSPDEIALIDDTVGAILPALQPRDSAFPKLWGAPDKLQREQYALTLTSSLVNWFEVSEISARLVARSADLAILRLHLGNQEEYFEDETSELRDILEQLSAHIQRPLDGNFQLMPDFRVFVGNYLYLIKPMQTRFWLRSTALADADGIALDLQQVVSPT